MKAGTNGYHKAAPHGGDRPTAAELERALLARGVKRSATRTAILETVAESDDHLVCTLCGSVIEFRDDEIERLQVEIAHALGFEIRSHRLEIHGACERCLATRR